MRDRIEEIRERVEKASAGRWYTTGDGRYGHDVRSETPHSHNSVGDPLNDICNVSGYTRNEVDTEGDAEFIAHAREDIPYLLDLLEAKETG